MENTLVVPPAEIGRPAIRPRVRRVRSGVRPQVLGERLFRDALGRERKCADRFGSPFAVLLLERRSSEAGRWAPVLRAVGAIKRDIDIMGWLEQDAVLGVILPDTAGKGALKVMRAIRREIDRRIGDSAALSISVYGHGDRSKGADLPAVDRLIESFVEPPVRPARDAAKRCLDIVGSLGLLLLFSPVLLGIFAVVKTTSPGPVLFRQVRVGRRRGRSRC